MSTPDKVTPPYQDWDAILYDDGLFPTNRPMILWPPRSRKRLARPSPKNL